MKFFWWTHGEKIDSLFNLEVEKKEDMYSLMGLFTVCELRIVYSFLNQYLTVMQPINALYSNDDHDLGDL